MGMRVRIGRTREKRRIMREEGIKLELFLGEFIFPLSPSHTWLVLMGCHRCHNIYLVLPQFLVTALSSLVFAIFAPTYSIVDSAPPASELLKSTAVAAAASSGEWDAVGIIFRFVPPSLSSQFLLTDEGM